eukprot:TRINITY_DN4144_c0_g1_i3.p1 TRINITY_DN4144_c0_g1~~TRINITY_DN4144_c0_g1_i3.p1  ORF type:complete len:206 (+),score=30.55 TRINITY_DN4144_c0_g1_i3:67-684(+)
MLKLILVILLTYSALAQISSTPRFKKAGSSFLVRKMKSPSSGEPTTTFDAASNKYFIKWKFGEYLLDDTTNDTTCCNAGIQRFDNELRLFIYANDASSRLIDFALNDNFEKDRVYLTNNEGRSWSIVVDLNAVREGAIKTTTSCAQNSCALTLLSKKSNIEVVRISYKGKDPISREFFQQLLIPNQSKKISASVCFHLIIVLSFI